MSHCIAGGTGGPDRPLQCRKGGRGGGRIHECADGPYSGYDSATLWVL